MEYLDQPAHDDTPKAHPAFFRGKATGINTILKIVSDVMMGLDNGTGFNNQPDIEQMRRSLLVWRDELDKNLPKEKVENKKS